MLVCRQSSKVKITLKFTVVVYYVNVVWPSVCVEHVNKKRGECFLFVSFLRGVVQVGRSCMSVWLQGRPS